MKTKITSLAIGKAKEYGEDKHIFLSSYKKDEFYQFCQVDEFGLQGDTQTDKRYHGGIDKAIHFGSNLHFDRHPLEPLAIGCNILVNDLDESDICVGDIYSLGDVHVQVTQPRQPCWKIGALFGKETSRYITKNNAGGWYVRVLQEGIIDLSEEMILETRLCNITIKELSYYLHILPSKEIIDEILALDFVAQTYKDDLTRLVSKLNN
jgi:MOSC domain-containing protein YiiM